MNIQAKISGWFQQKYERNCLRKRNSLNIISNFGQLVLCAVSNNISEKETSVFITIYTCDMS